MERLFARIREQGQRKGRNRRQRRAYLLHERFLMVAVNTGMRRGEIFYLPWAHIDLERDLIRVFMSTRFTVKEKREKVLPLHRDLKRYLVQQREIYPEEEWLLDSAPGNFSTGTLTP